MSPDVVPASGADQFDLTRLCQYFSERSPQPMVAVEGPSHVVRYLNPAFARLAGRGPDGLIGRPYAEAVPEGAGNGCLALLDRVLRTGVSENLPEQEHRGADRSYWSYTVWVVLGEDERPAGLMIQVTDATASAVYRRWATAMNEALMVSSVQQHELIEAGERGARERQELDAQVYHAQKLESLGVLAGGVAHDLNNILTPIIGYAELASDVLPVDSPAAPWLGEVGKNARRAADLVQQILAYAGKGRLVLEPADLSALVRDMGVLLGSAVSVNTELVYDLAPSIPPVEADATQLRQVVLNLVTNASEAVGTGGGTVTVRTGLIPADPRAPRSSHRQTDLPTGPSAFLEVTDKGCGMTADVVEKIFDPFFTTKFTGRGLGLAVVQGIARVHHGTIEVRSEPGRGSTFRLIFPCSTTAATVPVSPGPLEAWRGTGRVLVIDDEKQVGDIAARLLERAGLAVVVAGSGQEGLKVFRERQQEIDAVVLDLTMPGMGGLETAEALRGLRPDLPVVFMSGYSVPEETLRPAGPGLTGFVQKPFTRSNLLAAIRHALGQ